MPPQTVVEQRGIASHVPVVADVVVSPEGWIWVQRNVPGEDLGPVDVFDDTGEYRGTLPSTSPWPASFGDENTLLSLEEDELDIQRVILHVMRKE